MLVLTLHIHGLRWVHQLRLQLLLLLPRRRLPQELLLLLLRLLVLLHTIWTTMWTCSRRCSGACITTGRCSMAWRKHLLLLLRRRQHRSLPLLHSLRTTPSP